MLNFFREEDYEKSLIELFQNDLEYEYVYGPDIERDFYLNLKILKMGSLYRRMPSLWTTYRMVFL